MIRADVISIFPEMIREYAAHSLLGKAQGEGVLDLEAHDLRHWGKGSHRIVDEPPCGGGPGMVMRPEPFFAAVESVTESRWGGEQPEIILLCPQGERLTQPRAEELAAGPGWILLCGRYEGVDERVREHLATRVMSLGDFVLMGGEVAALALLEATVRLQEGFLTEGSLDEESFSGGLEYPQYTKPRDFRGWEVPGVLLSGHHRKIREWRSERAAERTLSAQTAQEQEVT